MGSLLRQGLGECNRTAIRTAKGERGWTAGNRSRSEKKKPHASAKGGGANLKRMNVTLMRFAEYALSRTIIQRANSVLSKGRVWEWSFKLHHTQSRETLGGGPGGLPICRPSRTSVAHLEKSKSEQD